MITFVLWFAVNENRKGHLRCFQPQPTTATSRAFVYIYLSLLSPIRLKLHNDGEEGTLYRVYSFRLLDIHSNLNSNKHKKLKLYRRIYNRECWYFLYPCYTHNMYILFELKYIINLISIYLSCHSMYEHFTEDTYKYVYTRNDSSDGEKDESTNKEYICKILHFLLYYNKYIKTIITSLKA